MSDPVPEAGRPPAEPPPPTIREAIALASSYDPGRAPAPPHRSRRAIGLCLAAGTLLFAVNAWMEVGARGLEATLLGALLAVAPVPIYMVLFLWIDRYDPEPPWAIALAFAWGALPAGLASTFLNDAFLRVAGPWLGHGAAVGLAATVWAPVVEEVCKGVGLLLILLFLRRELDTVLDGVVYGGVIGLGFATTENVDYYALGFAHMTPEALLELAMMRGVLKPFAHSFYAALTGIGCGVSRETPRGARRVTAPILGLLAACALHMVHNTLAELGDAVYLIAYTLFLAPLFIVFLGGVAYLADRERRILRTMLAVEVRRGTVPAEHVELATSRRGRLLWQLAAIVRPRLLGDRRRYLGALAKIAFCYWHLDRAAAAGTETKSAARIGELRTELEALRSRI